MQYPLLLLICLLTLTSCSTPFVTPQKLSWSGENEKYINQYLQSQERMKPSVAIFDWDNTVIKNDVGDAMMLWMVKNDLLLRPLSWEKTSKWLNKAALRELSSHCTDVPVLQPLKTSKNLKCADTILSVYMDGKAWKESFNKDTMEPAYAWLSSLLHGRGHGEVKSIAREAIEFNLKNSPETMIQIGTRKYQAFMRIYPQMKKLISDLQSHEVTVWIVSASPQPIVEVFGEYVQVKPENVIGIRNTQSKNGQYEATLQGCGPYPDKNQEIITYRQGKRCWINKIIFKMQDKQDQMNKRSPISLAAGDSDTDAFFLKDAHDLHIVINRNKVEVMCHALANSDGKWILNPMFIEPKPRRVTPYDCRPYALQDQVEH